MSASPFVVAALPTDLDAQCRAILRTVARHGRGCVHLVDHPVGSVCVIHPMLVRCLDCANRHVATHSVAEEFDCDLCGERIDRYGDDELSLMLAHLVEVDTTVSIGRGRRAAVGVVALTGWAACPTCCPALVVR